MAAARKLLLLATFVEFASAAKVADGRGGGVLVTSHARTARPPGGDRRGGPPLPSEAPTAEVEASSSPATMWGP